MKQIPHILIAWYVVALLMGACTQMPFDQPDPSPSARTIQLTALAPDWEVDTRATLSEQEGSLALSAAFSSSEKVRIFVVQDGQLYDLGDQPLSDLSEDGATAKINITLPEGVDATREVDLIGYSGRNQKYIDTTKKEGAALISADPHPYNDLSLFRAPVYFRLKGVVPTPEVLAPKIAKFEHLGAYEVVHFTNKSSELMQPLVSLSEVVSYGPRKPWAYESGYVSGKGMLYYYYDIISGEIIESSDYGRSDFYVVQDLPPGETHSIVSWCIPRPGAVFGNIVLDLYIKGGKHLQSDGLIAAQSRLMEVGHVYHAYGYWDGTQVVSLEPDGKTKRPQAYVRVTTDKAVGESITFRTYVPYGATNTSWVDYNDNGIKDDITEAAPKNYSDYTATLRSQSLTFHGGFESIRISGQQISAVEVSPVAKITELDVSNNNLSEEALNALFESLPDVSKLETSIFVTKKLSISDNPGAERCNASIAFKKGWILDVTYLDESQPYMWLSLSGYGSKDFYFVVDAAPEDRAGVWIDLNGDALKGDDEGFETIAADALQKKTALSDDVVVYGKVTKLDIVQGSFFALYGGTNTSLKHLSLKETGVLAAVLDHFTELEYVDLSANGLRVDVIPLKVAALPKLKVLNLSGCEVGDLDLSQNTQLTYLNVEGNKMTTLDVSSMPKLRQLICSQNYLEKLDISNNPHLQHLEIVQNNFGTEVISGIITALPDRTGRSAGGLWLKSNPGALEADYRPAKQKNWTVDARNSKADSKLRRPIMIGEDW